MTPTFFYIEERNLIQRNSIFCWLSKESIEAIIESCNYTLDYYKKNNYDDNFIEKINTEIYCKEYENKFSTRITKKIKTNVYIMIDHNTKYCKIGRSDNPLKREKTLQSEKPTIELIYKFECEYGIEKELHNKFNDKKIRGEWFNLDNNDIEYIKNNYQ